MLARSRWQCRLSGGWRQKETECTSGSAERRVVYLSRGSWEMNDFQINVGQAVQKPPRIAQKCTCCLIGDWALMADVALLARPRCPRLIAAM